MSGIDYDAQSASSGSSATTALPMHQRASTPRAGRPRSSPHSRPTSRASSRCSPSKASHFHRPATRWLKRRGARRRSHSLARGPPAPSCGGRARATGHAAASPFARSTAHRAMGARHSLPPAFTPTLQPQRTGLPNASLEGLAFSDDGCTAWLAMEMARVQDGPAPPCRPLAARAHHRTGRGQRPGTAAAGLHPDAVPRARRRRGA
jgi:hypothetical protein